MFAILRGERPAYTFDGHNFDRCGVATGKLLGGNVAVIAELISTPYDIIVPGSILFIEDIAEPIYKIERILYQLKLSGVLGASQRPDSRPVHRLQARQQLQRHV